MIENNKACVTHEYVTIYFCFVKVNHSQRLSQKPLTPWVIAENNGRILCGHCDCMAGLGECCSHVASLLWAVECGVRYRESLTVTQQPAYWAIPSGVKTSTMLRSGRLTSRVRRPASQNWQLILHQNQPAAQYQQCVMMLTTQARKSCASYSVPLLFPHQSQPHWHL